jgi:hypothetical protein
VSLLTVEQQFEQAMIADATLKSLFGGTVRLYNIQMPQNPTYPAAAFQRISTNRQYVHPQSQGAGKTAPFGWIRLQLTIWGDPLNASSQDQVQQIADAFRTAIHKFNPSPDAAGNGLFTERPGIEPGTQPPLFKWIQDWQIYFVDATP